MIGYFVITMIGYSIMGRTGYYIIAIYLLLIILIFDYNINITILGHYFITRICYFRERSSITSAWLVWGPSQNADTADTLKGRGGRVET